MVPIEKLENGKTIKHKERFIDSVRVMASSLSSLADNLAEDLEIGQCKDCKSSLKYITTKDGLRTFDGVNYNKTYEKKFDLKIRISSMTERLTNSVSFCREVFIHMRTIADKIFTEMSLPSKNAFYRNLAIESITNADYKHAKRRVWIDFRLQSLGQDHDLYVLSDTLLRIHYCVFKSFKNKRVEIYELKQSLFLSAPRLAC